MVELTAQNEPIDALLRDLTEQSKYHIVIHDNDGDKTVRELTLKTGKVPFWDALVKVCDAADLQIGAVSGFAAPGHAYLFEAAKRSDRPAPKLPGGPIPSSPRHLALIPSSIVLVPRGTQAKRPASVHGAVLVSSIVSRTRPSHG